MAFVEEYELEFEFEDDEVVLAGGRGSPASRFQRGLTLARNVRGQVAQRMRAAPLPLLFVASVVGFLSVLSFAGSLASIGSLLELWRFELPASVPENFVAEVDAMRRAATEIFVVGLVAAVLGIAGALLVFWRHIAGWALLVATAAWLASSRIILYFVFWPRLTGNEVSFSTWFALQDAADWTMMAVWLLPLALLFLPGVLRWVGFLGTRRPVVEDERFVVPSSARSVQPMAS